MMKDQNKYDNGLMTVLLDRYKNQRLPAVQALQKKVDTGEKLSDIDMMLLKDISKDVSEIGPLLERHPECNEIATRMMNLCSDIARKGLANEE